MGSISKEQAKNTLQFLQKDFPELVLATARVETNDMYIRDLLDRTNCIDKKYNHHPFVQAMIIAYCDYIDKAVRKLNKK